MHLFIEILKHLIHFLLSFHTSFLSTGLFNGHLDHRNGERIIIQFNKSLYGTKATNGWYSITSCLWFISRLLRLGLGLSTWVEILVRG